ncbi:hypothetical protein EV130_10569 [Rhizobium azibense]|uniref:Uncharacterized protein n=1 Tax=Rhizobium azibense TaxID=1136135 RepID=A0A4R3S770_9HYPH|nr:MULTISPECIES: hypothetical protein [Rhizobium]TCU25417.1 hypothetical protein EV130_10569 [Rhizobium azibense]TCU40296.1 hypothetical protein EV129_102439 [Rhizobium azibense]
MSLRVPEPSARSTIDLKKPHFGGIQAKALARRTICRMKEKSSNLD